MSPLQLLTLLIVAVTVVGIAVGRWPLVRSNRTSLSLIGAAALLVVGAVPLHDLSAALDLETLLLLLSMMLINGVLFLSGFFRLVISGLVRAARTPRMLLAVIILSSGVLSALFLNDTIVLIMTPLVLEALRLLQRRPLPYLLGIAVAANVGSAATITGNPQNIIIGSTSQISFAAFLSVNGPIALVGLLICWLVIVLVHRDEFAGRQLLAVPEVGRTRIIRPLVRKVGLTLTAMTGAFLLGVPVAQAAAAAAGVLLFSRRLRPERVLRTVDWQLLAFFAALFIITYALEAQQLSTALFRVLAPLAEAGLPMFALISLVLSNLISNVPAVLLLQNLIPAYPQTDRAWLMLAAASTFAGNLTLLGSVANLILAELAARWGVQVTFGAYLRVGVPITLLTLLLAVLFI
jgi:Na+/H+ antiporter NhaD/arsenite permease-like protein